MRKEIVSEDAKFIELVWDACNLNDYPRRFSKEVRVVADEINKCLFENILIMT